MKNLNTLITDDKINYINEFLGINNEMSIFRIKKQLTKNISIMSKKKEIVCVKDIANNYSMQFNALKNLLNSHFGNDNTKDVVYNYIKENENNNEIVFSYNINKIDHDRYGVQFDILICFIEYKHINLNTINANVIFHTYAMDEDINDNNFYNKFKELF